MVEMDDKKLSLIEQQKVLTKYATYPAGESIRNHLSEKTLKILETELSRLGLPLGQLENFKPGFIMLTAAAVQAIQLGYKPELGIDQHFLTQARGKKQILEIESFQQQIQMLDELPVDEESVMETFSTMKGNEAIWKALVQAWIEGDDQTIYQEAIAKPLAETPKVKPLYDLLFFKRNEKMASATAECVETHKLCFVVVGAGHLVGPGGIVDLLKNKAKKIQRL